MLQLGDVALVALGISNTIPYLSKLPVVIVIRNRMITCLNFESLPSRYYSYRVHEPYG